MKEKRGEEKTLFFCFSISEGEPRDMTAISSVGQSHASHVLQASLSMKFHLGEMSSLSPACPIRTKTHLPSSNWNITDRVPGTQIALVYI